MEIVPAETGTMATSQAASVDNVKTMANVFERRKSVGGNNDFRMEVREEKEVYICNICGYEGEKPGGVKSHISKKHREKPAEEDEIKELKKLKDKDKSFEFNMEELKEWTIPESQVKYVEDMLDLTDKVGKDDTAIKESDMNKVDEAKSVENAEEKIYLLEEENNELKAKVKSLEDEVQTKRDLIDMGTARVNSLEMEKINREAKNEQDISKFQNAFYGMKKEILELREAKGGSGDKDLKAKLKASTKAQETAEMRVAEMIKKCSEESNNRARVEAEVTRSHKMIEHLEKLLEFEKATRGLEVGGQGASRMDVTIFSILQSLTN